MPVTATISATLYGAISTRSGFLQALGPTGPSGQLGATVTMPATCLATTRAGGRRLRIEVLTGTATAQGTPCDGRTVPAWFSLQCTVGAGSCNGVYPVVVAVSDGQTTLDRFTTFLTFAEAPAHQPLRTAVVVSLGAASRAKDLANATTALAHARGVPLDVALSPSAATTMATTPAGSSALQALAKVVGADDAAHELVRSPFVSVDPGQLATSGLADQLHHQLNRGARALRQVGLDGATAAAGWLATSPVTQSTTAGLSATGVSRLVVPDSSLATPTATSLEWGEPFSLTPGTSSVEALAADGSLSAQMVAGTTPVLAAERLLADLAFLHFERPSLPSAQGVVVEPPAGWEPDATFLATLLDGLRSDPVLAPATLSSLFSQLSVGADGSPSTRALATSAPSTPWPASQVTMLRAGQADLRSFAAAVVNGQATVDQLARGWLEAEADTLTTPTRQLALTAADADLHAQLGTVGISGGQITLTSLKGALPITLTKTASWNLRGALVVSGDHLAFPHGERFMVLIDHPTQSVRIPVDAETTGDLTLTAVLTTPDGAVVVARQRIVVHSTQTSVVAILLTAGAALVLGAWWVRTLRRDRRARRR
jgi:hypothetical protein